jgi:hypothetical protein
VGLFEVPMACKSEFEELVGKDAGLWEAIHTLSDFHVDVIFDDIFGISRNGIFIYSCQSRGVLRYIFLMLAPQNFWHWAC